MWGVIPAAGTGSRIQPLAFSKELLPVGSRFDGQTERPQAVSEYLVERMMLAGADKICFIISPGKSDILEYYGAGIARVDFAYVVQPRPSGLCDAIFRALTVVGRDEQVLVGLPDTVWFPETALRELPDGQLSFLLFPVVFPEFFDAVVTDDAGKVLQIQVKQRDAKSNWIWGAFKLPGAVFRELFDLWKGRACRDEYFGTLINAWLEGGGSANGIRAGESYVDIGTLDGYRSALALLNGSSRSGGPPRSSASLQPTFEPAAPHGRIGS